MSLEPYLILPNSTKVLFLPEKEDSFIPGEKEIEKMLPIANSLDFLTEIEAMKSYASYAPFTLLVYDDILALGVFFNNENLSVSLRPYSGSMVRDYVEKALSECKEPIKVIEKTTTHGEVLRKLKPIIDLDWINYNPETNVIREKDEPCYAQRCLEQMPLGEDLYSLTEWNGKIRVIHMKLTKNVIAMSPGCLIAGLKCVGAGSEFYDDDIQSLERQLQESHPDALVIRQPLKYCSVGNEIKPYACLARIFEQTYVNKLLPKKQLKSIDYTIN